MNKLEEKRIIKAVVKELRPVLVKEIAENSLLGEVFVDRFDRIIEHKLLDRLPEVKTNLYFTNEIFKLKQAMKGLNQRASLGQ